MSDERTVKDGFLDTVLKQIESGSPPEARDTFKRLTSEGHSETEALHLISAVLRAEMDKMIRESKSFDEAAYTTQLKKLPHV